jgi:tetratricopeptide (TPR) repeat protein
MGFMGTYYGIKGYMCMAKGDNKNARVFFEKAINHGLEKPNHLTYYGVLLLRTGEFEYSEKILKKALELCPHDVPLYSTIKMNIAMCAWKLNDIDRSLELVESIYDKYKNSAIYGLYGFLLSEKEDYDFICYAMATMSDALVKYKTSFVGTIEMLSQQKELANMVDMEKILAEIKDPEMKAFVENFKNLGAN